MRRPARYHIERAEQLEALTSPVRMEILSAVEALGPCPVARLARSVGRTSSSLYFHLERLVEVGLLEREEREEGSRYRTPGRSMSIRYPPEDPVRLRLLLQATTAILRSAERTIREAFASGRARVRGRSIDTLLIHERARLTPEQLREITAHARAISEIYAAGRRSEEGTLHSLTLGLAPVISRSQTRS